MAKFYWVRKKDGHKSKLDNVRGTAYAVIEDYIKRNQHKTAEQLKDDLNFEGDGWSNWDNHGTHPFTIQQHVKTEEYYFSERLRLENDEVIRISKQCWGTTGTMEDDWNGFKNKMDECGYTIEKENIMRRFCWAYKEGGFSEYDGVGQTARAVIADYIERNKNKSAEQLRDDLEIRERSKKNTWCTTGGHPFTLVEHADDKRHFRNIIHLDGGEEIRISDQWGAGGDSEAKWKRLVDKMNNFSYTLLAENERMPPPPMEIGAIILQGAYREVSLLQQFKQIILYGPPGTGKTFRAKTEILPQMLGVNKDEVDDEQGGRWDIVQFHPSYNYEDFVRGVKVETIDNNVVYKTIDRIFGDICKRAENDSEKSYVLIIDEINRANVSAVLGELIYALEYRGEQIETPYAVEGDSGLVIPENLYIIGTMNTADRTIGQIDYAVRRRFAFVACLPDKNVITDNNARNVFLLVDEIFEEHISPDYDADDVRIGHSYFLAEGGELARKIIYQVVPILREYVKDGILLKGAEEKILEVEDIFKNDVTIDDEPVDVPRKKRMSNDRFFYWGKEGRFVNGAEGMKNKDDTTIRCCFVSVEDMQERCNWESCKDIGFIVASGVSNVEEVAKAKGRIRRIRQGYILIASLMPDSQGNGGGVIGMGEVLARAVPINEFKVNEIPILDYEFSDGQKYRDKFPSAAADADDAEKCDWMVAVKWIKTLPRSEAEGPPRLPRTVFRVSQGKMDIVNKKFGKNK